jgi:tetratricopeptide (TPR) repeat protein
MASRILLLRARLATGDNEGAITLAESMVEGEPETPAARLVLATTLTAAGELDRALDIYGALAEEYPNDAGLQVEIAAVLTRSGDAEGARATIEAAIERNPEDMRLLWALASYLEVDGDIEGAIDVYEKMYARDSNNLVVANNLASLLGTFRDDDASLERAWTIARRFRDFENPAIQDTYGWIAHRRGNSEEALNYLEPAAAELPSDIIVQFHLAEALFAVGRLEPALEQYRTTLELAGVGDTRPQILQAQTRIVEIEEALAAAE